MLYAHGLLNEPCLYFGIWPHSTAALLNNYLESLYAGLHLSAGLTPKSAILVLLKFQGGGFFTLICFWVPEPKDFCTKGAASSRLQS